MLFCRTDEVIDMTPIPTMAATGALHPIDGEGVVATIIIITTTIVMTPTGIRVVVGVESIGGSIGMIVDVAGIEMETTIEVILILSIYWVTVYLPFSYILSINT